MQSTVQHLQEAHSSTPTRCTLQEASSLHEYSRHALHVQELMQCAAMSLEVCII